MPKLKPQEMERRRGRIVAAARACFTRTGFSDCSMDDICAEAGLSKGAVYNHFPSKEELIHAVADDQARSLQQLPEGKGLDEIAGALLDLFHRPAGAPETRLELYAVGRAFSDEALLTRMRRNRALLQAALARALARLEAEGQVRLHAGAARTGEILLTFLQGVLTRPLLAPGGKVREEFDLLLGLLVEKVNELSADVSGS
jgi:AcrR family transcriptional regulator